MSFVKNYVLSKFFGCKDSGGSGGGSGGGGDLKALVERTITEIEDNVITNIGVSAFQACTALISVNLPNVSTAGTNAFADCSSLADVYFPKLTVFGGGCFARCTSLTEISDAQFPELIAIPDLGFNGCSGLLEVNLSKVQRVYQYHAFGGCSKLQKVVLRSCTNLGTSAFAWCRALSHVDLSAPGQITIDNSAFSACVLKSFIIRSSVIANLTAGGAFTESGLEYGNGYIYVPRALLSDDDATKDYRRATNWSGFAARFRALEDYTVDGTVTGELDESKI